MHESPSQVAEAVRAARLEAGLSLRELARRTGLTQPALGKLEQGGDPRLSTLRALVAELPTLDVSSLLGRAPRACPPASAGAWELMAGLSGYRARRASHSVTVEPDGRVTRALDIQGLRSTASSLKEPTRRSALMHVAFVGPTNLRFDLAAKDSDLLGESQEIQEEGVGHRFSFPRALDHHGMRYERIEARPSSDGEAPGFLGPPGRPFEQGTAQWVDRVFQELVLRVRFRGPSFPSRVQFHVWPVTLGTDRERSTANWRALHPGAPASASVSRDGRCELTVVRPLLGLCYGLSWDAESQVPGEEGSRTAVSPSRLPDPSTLLQEARERAGLSKRELARRMDVSPATVVNLERSGNPRISTLRSCLRQLPELSPVALVSPREPRSTDELWNYYRDVYGSECELDSRVLTIRKDGQARLHAETKGLLATPAALTDLRVRHGVSRLAALAGTTELDSVTVDEGEDSADVRVRVASRRRGAVVSEVRMSGTSAKRRVSYTRRMTVKGTYRHPTNPGELQPDGWSGPEAIHMPPGLPARRIVVEVRFTGRAWPYHLQAAVFPLAFVPSRAIGSSLAGLHPEGLNLRCDPKAGVATLTVERPLIGFRYSLSWFLHDHSDLLSDN
jgi:transcriptional regulator with XRE-family HTH domain